MSLGRFLFLIETPKMGINYIGSQSTVYSLDVHSYLVLIAKSETPAMQSHSSNYYEAERRDK